MKLSRERNRKNLKTRNSAGLIKLSTGLTELSTGLNELSAGFLKNSIIFEKYFGKI
jgi:X-X-X-Leu-X-X-Gly heptad repeat protein